MSVKATFLHDNRFIITLRRMTGETLLEMNRLVCCHRTIPRVTVYLPASTFSGVSTSTETGEMDPDELTPT